MLYIYISIIICFIYDPLQDLINFNTTNISNLSFIKNKISILIDNPYSFKFITYSNTFILFFISFYFYKYKAAPLLYILTVISFIQYIIQYNFFYLSIINEYISSSKNIDEILFNKQYSIQKEICLKPDNLIPYYNLKTSMNLYTLNENIYEIKNNECFKISITPTSINHFMNENVNLSYNLNRSFIEAFLISFLITLFPFIDFIYFF